MAPPTASAVPASPSGIEALVGGVLTERYALESVVGADDKWAVFVAHDDRLDRRVIIKLLLDMPASSAEHEADVERFRHQCQQLAQLHHPGIENLLNCGHDKEYRFLVFEYIGGANLAALARSGPLPVRRALEIGIAVGQALAFAHSVGIVHGDVCPGNVLLQDDTPKLTEFGRVWPADADELAQRSADDVRGLAAMLAELVHAEPPRVGLTAVPQAGARAPQPASRRQDEIPVCLRTALTRAHGREPRAGFASMRAFVQELDTCLAELDRGGGEVTGVIAGAGLAAEPLPPTPSSRAIEPVALGPAAPAVAARPRPPHLVRGLVIVALALALAGAVVAAVLLLHHGKTGNGATATSGKAARLTPPAAPASGAPVALRAIAAYDPPPGDGVEGNQRLPFAVDGNPSTAWVTEHYATPTFGGLKPGVGLVLDAGSPRRLHSLTARTTTPGFVAVVKAGPTPRGPFAPVSPSRTVAGGATSIPLAVRTPARYYLLWITRLAPAAQPYVASVNELVAR